MLHLRNNTLYSSEDWHLMQCAYDKAAMILHNEHQADEDTERLARCIMNLFDQGIRDEEMLVAKAVERELLVLGIAARRDAREAC